MADVRVLKLLSGVSTLIDVIADVILAGGLKLKSIATFAGSEMNVVTSGVQTTAGGSTVLKAITLSDNTNYNILVNVQARRTGTVGRSGFLRRAVVFREAAGAATLVGTIDTIGADKTSGTITASTTIAVSGNDVQVTVTGAGGQTINWTCTIMYQGVSTNT